MKIVNVFLISCIIFISCNENSTENNLDNISLIPFKMNNYWKYNDSKYDSTGNIFISDTIIYKVDIDTIILNQQFFKYDISNFYYTVKEDGIWQYEILGDSVKNCLYLKYPCKIGDTYTFTFGRPNIVTVTSLNEKVTVEAGEFTCIEYHLEYNSVSPYINIYVAPGVGIIKQESFSGTHYSSDYKTGEESLLQYQLN